MSQDNIQVVETLLVIGLSTLKKKKKERKKERMKKKKKDQALYQKTCLLVSGLVCEFLKKMLLFPIHTEH